MLVLCLETSLTSRVQQLDDLDGLATQLFALVIFARQTAITPLLIGDELVDGCTTLKLAEPALHGRLFERHLFNLIGRLIWVHQRPPIECILNLLGTRIFRCIVYCLGLANKIGLVAPRLLYIHQTRCKLICARHLAL